MTLSICEIIGSENAITYGDGDKFSFMFKRQYKLNSLIGDDSLLIIDFSGLVSVSLQFFNSAILNFIIDNKECIDKIKFIDSSNSDGKVSGTAKQFVERFIPIALDNDEWETHNKILELILDDDFDNNN